MPKALPRHFHYSYHRRLAKGDSDQRKVRAVSTCTTGITVSRGESCDMWTYGTMKFTSKGPCNRRERSKRTKPEAVQKRGSARWLNRNPRKGKKGGKCLVVHVRNKQPYLNFNTPNFLSKISNIQLRATLI